MLIGRGIDHPTPIYTDWQVADVGDHVSAADTTTAGIRALDDAAGRPAFVWLHYFDVHEHHQIDVPPALLAAVHDVSPGPQGRRYRALLRAIDGEVGHFLDELAARKLADSTIVVVFGDHGENLDDPRSPDTHGQVTYAPLVRIPFAIRVPGVSRARREDSVSLVDLAPTLADLAALDLPDLDGVDLVPALVGGSLPARPIAIHEELQWSIVEWPYQLIVRPADNTTELYDLDRDPAEHDDLAARAPDIVMRLRARYAAVPRRSRRPDAGGTSVARSASATATAPCAVIEHERRHPRRVARYDRRDVVADHGRPAAGSRDRGRDQRHRQRELADDRARRRRRAPRTSVTAAIGSATSQHTYIARPSYA